MVDPAAKGQALAIDNFTFSANSSSGVFLPQLSIRLVDNTVVVSWPANGASFSLQANSDLSQAANWASVPQQVVTSNGLNSVSIPISSIQQFYRLKQ
jgi:hypothetical protein